MFTSNNNSYDLVYNGPHKIHSTVPMGFSVTVRNVSISEVRYLDQNVDGVDLPTSCDKSPASKDGEMNHNPE